MTIDHTIAVRRRKVTDYIPDPRNANRGTERGQYMIDRSLEDVGLARSIVAAADDTVPAGNKTLQAAVDAGIEDVIEVETDGNALVVVKRRDWPSVDDERARKYAFYDNRTAEVDLDWDAAAIVEALEDGVDLSDMWRDFELDEFEELSRIEAGDLPEIHGVREIGRRLAIRVVLFSDGVELLERAIQATGEVNRAEAVKTICEAYLNAERQLDF